MISHNSPSKVSIDGHHVLRSTDTMLISRFHPHTLSTFFATSRHQRSFVTRFVLPAPSATPRLIHFTRLLSPQNPSRLISSHLLFSRFLRATGPPTPGVWGRAPGNDHSSLSLFINAILFKLSIPPQPHQYLNSSMPSQAHRPLNSSMLRNELLHRPHSYIRLSTDRIFRKHTISMRSPRHNQHITLPARHPPSSKQSMVPQENNTGGSVLKDERSTYSGEMLGCFRCSADVFGRKTSMYLSMISLLRTRISSD